MKLIEHFINGKKYSGDSKRYSTIFNPATGEESGKVNLGSTNDLNEAVKMTSYNAAQYIKENELGYIGENKISNILVLDKTLKIKQIYLNGIKINE